MTGSNGRSNADKDFSIDRSMRRVILEFLERNAGRSVRVNEIVEKLGVSRSSIYTVFSDLRKVGMLPKSDRAILQPVPVGFDSERALEALRMLQRNGKRTKRRRMQNLSHPKNERSFIARLVANLRRSIERTNKREGE